MTVARPKITERDVQIGVTSFLELDGWRAIRTDPVSDRKRGKGFGELGMPDYLYVRYWTGTINQMAMKPPYESWAQVLWIEFKAPGKKPAQHQFDWHQAERLRGALVKVVDGFESFRRWYIDESGLNRRMLLR
jgi:hypothetical protein